MYFTAEATVRRSPFQIKGEIMITSAQNTQVKNIIKLNQKAKARREQKLFVAEGRKMFLEAPENLIDKIYVAESMLDDEEVIEKVRRFSWESVENGVFRQMCDTQTPQGILTVLRQPSYQMQDLLKEKNPLIMVLEDLQDPGNAGTIIRTGEGAGVSGVFLTKTCVDITNPKVIRATMGSVYRIPFLYVEDVVSLKQQLQDRGIRFLPHIYREKILMTGKTIKAELHFSSETKARVSPTRRQKRPTA